MRRTKISFASTLSLALLLLSSPAWAQIEIGNVIVGGEAEVGGLPRHRTGTEAKLQEYRSLPDRAIVPQLQFMIGSKGEDFYLNFDSSKLGLDDQNYRLRFGRYGLLDVEVEWDQLPHLFSTNTARTPYNRDGGGGTYTLSSKPPAFAGTDVRDWVNTNASHVDLKLFQGMGRFKLRYTPSPGWTFTSNYSSLNISGKRAIGAYFGTSPGGNMTELPEPIDYQIHNMELGGEYAASWWSLGLKYNMSLFHNNVSTLVWDNPINPGVGSACVDDAAYSNTNGTGPCRGRMDLYPKNQAHTWALTGAASLPLKSRFMGTVSYGVRLQNDPFLPFTTNTALAQPSISRESLDGDVRPLMINATLVNNFFNRLNLKAYYRLFDLDNQSDRIDTSGKVAGDSSTSTDALRSFPYAFSRQNIGLDAGYDITRWLSAKLGYVWENMHRERREVLDSKEHIFGPTIDIKPLSWLLVRMGYKRSIRDAHEYDAGRASTVHVTETEEEAREDRLEALRKFDEAARNRDKYSMSAQINPWESLTFYGGFDFMNDRFPRSTVGLKDDVGYSPSIGLLYRPLDWITLFADYNWERFDWKMRAMERSAQNVGGCPARELQTPANCPSSLWTSRGHDQINTVSVGSDMGLLKELGLRIQYTFSDGVSDIRASGNRTAGNTAATNYPSTTNRWHEFLTRFDYQLHKNVGLRFGYYYNRFAEKDFGVDIMKPWMGDVDTGAGVQRSIFLGDRVKRPYSAHVGFLGLRFSF